MVPQKNPAFRGFGVCTSSNYQRKKTKYSKDNFGFCLYGSGTKFLNYIEVYHSLVAKANSLSSEDGVQENTGGEPNLFQAEYASWDLLKLALHILTCWDFSIPIENQSIEDAKWSQVGNALKYILKLWKDDLIELTLIPGFSIKKFNIHCIIQWLFCEQFSRLTAKLLKEAVLSNETKQAQLRDVILGIQREDYPHLFYNQKQNPWIDLNSDKESNKVKLSLFHKGNLINYINLLLRVYNPHILSRLTPSKLDIFRQNLLRETLDALSFEYINDLFYPVEINQRKKGSFVLLRFKRIYLAAIKKACTNASVASFVNDWLEKNTPGVGIDLDLDDTTQPRLHHMFVALPVMVGMFSFNFQNTNQEQSVNDLMGRIQAIENPYLGEKPPPRYINKKDIRSFPINVEDSMDSDEVFSNQLMNSQLISRANLNRQLSSSSAVSAQKVPESPRNMPSSFTRDLFTPKASSRSYGYQASSWDDASRNTVHVIFDTIPRPTLPKSPTQSILASAPLTYSAVSPIDMFIEYNPFDRPTNPYRRKKSQNPSAPTPTKRIMKIPFRHQPQLTVTWVRKPTSPEYQISQVLIDNVSAEEFLLRHTIVGTKVEINGVDYYIPETQTTVMFYDRLGKYEPEVFAIVIYKEEKKFREELNESNQEAIIEITNNWPNLYIQRPSSINILSGTNAAHYITEFTGEILMFEIEYNDRATILISKLFNAGDAVDSEGLNYLPYYEVTTLPTLSVASLPSNWLEEFIWPQLATQQQVNDIAIFIAGRLFDKQIRIGKAETAALTGQQLYEKLKLGYGRKSEEKEFLKRIFPNISMLFVQMNHFILNLSHVGTKSEKEYLKILNAPLLVKSSELLDIPLLQNPSVQTSVPQLKEILGPLRAIYNSNSNSSFREHASFSTLSNKELVNYGNMKKYLDALNNLIKIYGALDDMIYGLANTHAVLDRLIGAHLGIEDTDLDYITFRHETTSSLFQTQASQEVFNAQNSSLTTPGVEESYTEVLKTELATRIEPFKRNVYGILKKKIEKDVKDFTRLREHYRLALDVTCTKAFFNRYPNEYAMVQNELDYYQGNVEWLTEAIDTLQKLQKMIDASSQTWAKLYEEPIDIDSSDSYSMLLNRKFQLEGHHLRRLLDILGKDQQPSREQGYYLLINGVKRYSALAPGNIKSIANSFYDQSLYDKPAIVQFGFNPGHTDKLFPPNEEYFEWYLKLN